jgi:hypothetical protein
MKEIYLSLFKEGWTLQSIDEMDFFYYLDLLVYNANKKEKQSRTTIDQVF